MKYLLIITLSILLVNCNSINRRASKAYKLNERLTELCYQIPKYTEICRSVYVENKERIGEAVITRNKPELKKMISELRTSIKGAKTEIKKDKNN